MSEDATVILIMLFWATVAYTIYLRLFVVRRLQKKLDKIVDAAIARPAGTERSAPTPDEERELRRLKERLHVLERIAVEKDDSLSRQIEELRAGGR